MQIGMLSTESADNLLKNGTTFGVKFRKNSSIVNNYFVNKKFHNFVPGRTVIENISFYLKISIMA